jgi:hypothetical protein
MAALGGRGGTDGRDLGFREIPCSPENPKIPR